MIVRLLMFFSALVLVATANAQQPDQARSIEAFREAGKVLQSPRCLNCHPAGERPTQTDRMTPHVPFVVRGADGHGPAGLPCNACHHAANYAESGVPGNPKWHLAPASMAWAGKSLGEICRQIKDRTRNGNLDMEALLKHMAEDPLVGWAWAPGGKRTPAPGTQAQFGATMRIWAEKGEFCPPD